MTGKNDYDLRVHGEQWLRDHGYDPATYRYDPFADDEPLTCGVESTEECEACT